MVASIRIEKKMNRLRSVQNPQKSVNRFPLIAGCFGRESGLHQERSSHAGNIGEGGTTEKHDVRLLFKNI